MREIDMYIEYLKSIVSDDETTMIMQVYINLGKRLSFDEDFFFGGTKIKKNLYFSNHNLDYINDCFKCGKVTCKSASYILNYVLKKLGVDINIVEDNHTFKKYRHIYNIIKEKSGRTYTVDLEDDIANIRYKARTTSFGVSRDCNGYIVSLDEQKKIHKNIGYIDNCYYNDYIYLLKSYISFFNDYNSKIDFVLQNIDYNLVDINYFDRRWMHERILNELFLEKLFCYVYPLELYKKINDLKEYINAFYIKNKNSIDIYVYSIDDNKYNRYSLEEYINYSIKNNIESRSNIPGYRTMKNKILKRY